MSVRQPVVIDVPFRADDIQIEQCIDQVQCEVDGSELTADERRLLKTYPTVYIIRGKERKRARGGYEYDDFVVYVGETNSIVRRTKEHYTDDVTYRSERGKKAWRRLEPAWQPHTGDRPEPLQQVAHARPREQLPELPSGFGREPCDPGKRPRQPAGGLLHQARATDNHLAGVAQAQPLRAGAFSGRVRHPGLRHLQGVAVSRAGEGPDCRGGRRFSAACATS